MKSKAIKISSVFLFCLLMTASGVIAEDGYFEGMLSFRMNVAETQTDMTYYTQGSKMRMEVDLAPGVKSIALADYEKNKIYMLMPERSAYAEIDIKPEDLEAAAGKNLKSASIIETDEKEEILGYECHKLISKKEGEITEIWVAKNFGKFYNTDFNRHNPTLMALQRRFEAEGAFPLRIISYSPDNQELFRMQVTNIDKKDLDDKLFTVPEDYNKAVIPAVTMDSAK